jgi:hypothetical protein
MGPFGFGWTRSIRAAPVLSASASCCRTTTMSTQHTFKDGVEEDYKDSVASPEPTDLAGTKKIEEVYNADLAAAIVNTDLNPWSLRSLKVSQYTSRKGFCLSRYLALLDCSGGILECGLFGFRRKFNEWDQRHAPVSGLREPESFLGACQRHLTWSKTVVWL